MQRVEHPTESPRITTDVPNLMDHWKEEFGDEKDLSSTEGQQEIPLSFHKVPHFFLLLFKVKL